MTGQCMMVMRATLGGSYLDWKKTIVEQHHDMYPGSCKAFCCNMGGDGPEGSILWVVVFDVKEAATVQMTHDVSKPSILREMIEDGILQKVTKLEWHTIACANDYDNVGGAQQEVLCVGRMLDPLTSKIAVAMDSLGRTQETFNGTCRYLIEAEFDGQVKELTAGMSQVGHRCLL